MNRKDIKNINKGDRIKVIDFEVDSVDETNGVVYIVNEAEPFSVSPSGFYAEEIVEVIARRPVVGDRVKFNYRTTQKPDRNLVADVVDGYLWLRTGSPFDAGAIYDASNYSVDTDVK